MARSASRSTELPTATTTAATACLFETAEFTNLPQKRILNPVTTSLAEASRSFRERRHLLRPPHPAWATWMATGVPRIPEQNNADQNQAADSKIAFPPRMDYNGKRVPREWG